MEISELTFEQRIAEFERIELDDRAKAFHEASHACIFHALGFKVKSVTVNPDYCVGNDAGQVVLYKSATRFLSGRRFELPDKYQQQVNNYSIGLLAGPVGENRITGEPVMEILQSKGLQSQGRGDWDSAFDNALRIGKDPYAKIAEWEATASAMLAEPAIWTAVERLVDLFINYGVDWVSGKHLQAVLNRSETMLLDF